MPQKTQPILLPKMHTNRNKEKPQMKVKILYKMLKALKQLKVAHPSKIANQIRIGKTTAHKYIKVMLKANLVTPVGTVTLNMGLKSTLYRLTEQGEETLKILEPIAQNIP